METSHENDENEDSFRAIFLQKMTYFTRGGRENENTKKKNTVFQIIESDNRHFNELLISPNMIADHMPGSLIDSMKAVNFYKIIFLV
jgi:hypothetical protein